MKNEKNKKELLLNEIESNKNKLEKKTRKVVLSDEEKKDVYAPEIEEDDDDLVRIVKGILQEKQINLKEISYKFRDTMEMNNFKRALRMHRSMSFERFKEWMRILDYEWQITYSSQDEAEVENE